MEKYIHIKEGRKEIHITRALERERERDTDGPDENKPSFKKSMPSSERHIHLSTV